MNTVIVSLTPKQLSCTCSDCVGACRRNPGWFSPPDAERALDAGLANKMMLDWLTPSSKLGNDDDVLVLSPASVGYEGGLAPEGPSFMMMFSNWTKGPCTFLREGLCGLHGTDHKPHQCRIVLCCDHTQGNTNYEVAALWQAPEAIRLIERWRAETGCEDTP